MEPDRQVGWIVNPFMEFLMDKLMASFYSGTVAVGSVPTNNSNDNSKPDNSNTNKPEPPKKVEPEPEPEAPLFDLFA